MIPEYRYRALSRHNDLHWAIRLRLLLLIPGSWRWNGWVRGWTAWLETRRTYGDEQTRPEESSGTATPDPSSAKDML